jgi:putative spermidine/putrescine transport system ATP-binding protein
VLLLLDEPLSALDAQVRVQLREEIRRIQLELGITAVFVTHDQAEALSVADRVGVLRSGRLEQIASPDELYERPATAFVAEFVGTMIRLPAVLTGACPVGRCSCSATVVRWPVPFLRQHGDRPPATRVARRGDRSGRQRTGGDPHLLGASTRLLVALPDGLEVRADVARADS